MTNFVIVRTVAEEDGIPICARYPSIVLTEQLHWCVHSRDNAWLYSETKQIAVCMVYWHLVLMYPTHGSSLVNIV